MYVRILLVLLLSKAMHLNQLETVTAALEAAADRPVDCKLVHQCNQLKEKLESEIQLGKAMQVTVETSDRRQTENSFKMDPKLILTWTSND